MLSRKSLISFLEHSRAFKRHPVVLCNVDLLDLISRMHRRLCSTHILHLIYLYVLFRSYSEVQTTLSKLLKASRFQLTRLLILLSLGVELKCSVGFKMDKPILLVPVEISHTLFLHQFFSFQPHLLKINLLNWLWLGHKVLGKTLDRKSVV